MVPKLKYLTSLPKKRGYQLDKTAVVGHTIDYLKQLQEESSSMRSSIRELLKLIPAEHTLKQEHQHLFATASHLLAPSAFPQTGADSAEEEQQASTSSHSASSSHVTNCAAHHHSGPGTSTNSNDTSNKRRREEALPSSDFIQLEGFDWAEPTLEFSDSFAQPSLAAEEVPYLGQPDEELFEPPQKRNRSQNPPDFFTPLHIRLFSAFCCGFVWLLARTSDATLAAGSATGGRVLMEDENVPVVSPFNALWTMALLSWPWLLFIGAFFGITELCLWSLGYMRVKPNQLQLACSECSRGRHTFHKGLFRESELHFRRALCCCGYCPGDPSYISLIFYIAFHCLRQVPLPFYLPSLLSEGIGLILTVSHCWLAFVIS